MILVQNETYTGDLLYFIEQKLTQSIILHYIIEQQMHYLYYLL